MGISKDTNRSHDNFSKKYNLNYSLASDVNKVLHEYFDVLKEKSMYGKKVMGTVRSTFIIDENGVLINEFRNVPSSGHAFEMLTFIKNI
jgi:peroxiredoxin Q/BCP